VDGPSVAVEWLCQWLYRGCMLLLLGAMPGEGGRMNGLVVVVVENSVHLSRSPHLPSERIERCWCHRRAVPTRQVQQHQHQHQHQPPHTNTPSTNRNTRDTRGLLRQFMLSHEPTVEKRHQRRLLGWHQVKSIPRLSISPDLQSRHVIGEQCSFPTPSSPW